MTFWNRQNYRDNKNIMRAKDSKRRRYKMNSLNTYFSQGDTILYKTDDGYMILCIFQNP